MREITSLCGSPMGYFSHSQNFTTNESIIDLIKFTLEIESQCNPGEVVDIVIVNNDSGWQEGIQFLNSLDGKSLGLGKIRVLNRKNIGRSFGGYNHAFKMLRSEYDYFIFTEDDIIISRDGYASKGIQFFNQTRNCGFVAYQSISSIGLDYCPEDALHAHGGVGLSNVSVLDAVVRHHGALPHADETTSQEYVDIINNGEIPFTNKIHKLGYKLISLPENIKLYDFAYDMMRGINVPRFPTTFRRALTITKMKAFEYKVTRSLHNLYKSIRL
jgi:hypothetical protein